MWEDIRTFAPVKNHLPLTMELCGISYCDGSYLIYRKCSPIWVAEYIVDGTGTVILDGVQYTASAGDVYLLPARHEHRYYSDSAHPWTKIFFNASGPVIQNLAEAYGLTDQVVFKNCSLETLFRELIALTEKKLEADELLSQSAMQIHHIFIELFRQSRKQENISPEAYQLKDYIDSRITGHLSMDDLSNSIHRSVDNTIHIFKFAFGKTPYAYYLERKLELAKNLLANTKLPINQISAYLGFEDPHYFSNRFRWFTQQSPSDYRKQNG